MLCVVVDVGAGDGDGVCCLGGVVVVWLRGVWAVRAVWAVWVRDEPLVVATGVVRCDGLLTLSTWAEVAAPGRPGLEPGRPFVTGGTGTLGNVVMTCAAADAEPPFARVVVGDDSVLAVPTATLGPEPPPLFRVYTPTPIKPSSTTPATTYRKMRSKSFTRFITQSAPSMVLPAVPHPTSSCFRSARAFPNRPLNRSSPRMHSYTQLPLPTRRTGEFQGVWPNNVIRQYGTRFRQREMWLRFKAS